MHIVETWARISQPAQDERLRLLISRGAADHEDIGIRLWWEKMGL